jgi:hypothetical protein
MPRLPLFQAQYKHQTINLDPKDREVLELTYEYRLLTSTQLGLLLDGRKRSSLKQKLQTLFHHGYLDRPPSQVVWRITKQLSWDMTYAITPKGLQSLGIITKSRIDNKNQKLTPHFMAHVRAINDIRIAITLATRNHPNLRLEFWIPEGKWQERIELNNQPKAIRPDGFFMLCDRSRLPEHQRYNYFLEYDTGSEDHGRLREKYRAYISLPEQKQIPNPLFPQEPIRGFRVLFVAHSEGRLNNMLRHIAELPMRNSQRQLFYFTTANHIQPTQPETILNPIWKRVIIDPQKQELYVSLHPLLP